MKTKKRTKKHDAVKVLEKIMTGKTCEERRLQVYYAHYVLSKMISDNDGKSALRRQINAILKG